MKAILLAIYLSFISGTTYDTTLLNAIQWRQQTDTSIGTVRTSNKPLTKRDLGQIIDKYRTIQSAFIAFESADKCIVSPMLDLRVVSNVEINSSKFFDVLSQPGFAYYGRYFKDVKILYITRQAALYNMPELAHELAHYFYDSCGIKFSSDDAEHARIEVFQAFLKERL